MESGISCFFSYVESLNIAILLIKRASTLLLTRIAYVIHRSRTNPYIVNRLDLLVVLGSGGHTAEMLNLLPVLQMERFKPRYYLADATGDMCLQKARMTEDSLKNEAKHLWVLLHYYGFYVALAGQRLHW